LARFDTQFAPKLLIKDEHWKQHPECATAPERRDQPCSKNKPFFPLRR